MFHKELYNIDENIRDKLAHLTETQKLFLSSYEFSYSNWQFEGKDNLNVDKAIFNSLDSLPFSKDFFDASDKPSDEKSVIVREPEEMLDFSVNISDLKQALTLYREKPPTKTHDLKPGLTFFYCWERDKLVEDDDFKNNLSQLTKIAEHEEEKFSQLNAGQLVCLVKISLEIDARTPEVTMTKKLFGAERERYLTRVLVETYPNYLICFLVKPERLELLRRGYHFCFCQRGAPFVGYRPASFGENEISLSTLKAFAFFIENHDSDNPSHRIYSVGRALFWLEHMGIATSERIANIVNYPDGAVLLDGVRWNKDIQSFKVIKELSECMYDILLPEIIAKHHEMNPSLTPYPHLRENNTGPAM